MGFNNKVLPLEKLLCDSDISVVYYLSILHAWFHTFHNAHLSLIKQCGTCIMGSP